MHKPTSSHNLQADWIDGRGIVVRNGGTEVEVQYGATEDLGTCYAYVPDLGFIGGWTTGRKRPPKMQFIMLVESINCGILYQDQNDLPTAPFIGHKR